MLSTIIGLQVLGINLEKFLLVTQKEALDFKKASLYFNELKKVISVSCAEETSLISLIITSKFSKCSDILSKDKTSFNFTLLFFL